MNENELPFFLPLEENLSGSEIVTRLRRGHVVRRAEWLEGFYIRICNEEGYDEHGYAIVGRSTIHTICTDGYFLHLATSSQPIRNPRLFEHNFVWDIARRDSEGLGMLFEQDWVDCGFIEAETFRNIRNEKRNVVRQFLKSHYEKLILAQG